MPKLATVAAFAAIATSSLARAGTDAADKVMLAALERAAEQRASQAADMAEAIANRVVSLKDRDEASIKAASKDKTAAFRKPTSPKVHGKSRTILLRLKGKAAGDASRAYQSFVRADAAYENITLDKFEK